MEREKGQQAHGRQERHHRPEIRACRGGQGRQEAFLNHHGQWKKDGETDINLDQFQKKDPRKPRRRRGPPSHDMRDLDQGQGDQERRQVARHQD